MITSASNPFIKQIRKLKDKKERQKTGMFYIEGIRIVGEAVSSNWNVDSLLFSPELLTSLFGQEMVRSFTAQGGNSIAVSADVFKSFAYKDGPQGISALVYQRWSNLPDLTLSDGDYWLALDAVADPGNLGAILRTNDAAGGKGIILLDQSTDPFDPTCIRASMGALFDQQLIKASFLEFSAWKKEQKVAVIGTSDKAKQDYYGWQYPPRLVLLMGSERHGLLEHHAALCDDIVSIPMTGRSDSLNLAVAAGLVVYEIYNQRRCNIADKIA
jgi:RNA methyltransferase, TrmH family